MLILVSLNPDSDWRIGVGPC